MQKMVTILLVIGASLAHADTNTGTSISTETDTDTKSENALSKCQNAKVLDDSILSKIPWNAIYPIKLAGIRLSPEGDGEPNGVSTKKMCSCQDDLGVPVPGLTTSMFEPARLIELVREPDCLMSFAGAKMNFTNGRMKGSTGSATEEYQGQKPAFWHYHYYAFPLLTMLEMIVPNRCNDDYMSIDLLHLSELDPTWSDPELAFFTNPEAAIFNNPISLAACLADVSAATVHQPIDALYWCAGAWGAIYPFSGYKSGKSSIPTKTSLLATRTLASQHRRLLAKKTYGDEALCQSTIAPIMQKTQYKMNMLYPVAQSNDTHQIGTPSFLWGEWRSIPGKEDAVYLVWRFVQCCSTYY